MRRRKLTKRHHRRKGVKTKARCGGLSIEMYPAGIYFAVGDAKKVLEIIQKTGCIIADVHRLQFLSTTKSGITVPMVDPTGATNVFLIWMRSVPRTPTEISLLSHECGHAVGCVFEYIGLPDGIPPKYDEITQYFVGYLVRKALLFYWDKSR